GLAQHERILESLDATARELAASAQAQASSTIDEVTRLMQTASEAPRAAAEIIGELRQELSARSSLSRAMLAESSCRSSPRRRPNSAPRSTRSCGPPPS